MFVSHWQLVYDHFKVGDINGAIAELEDFIRSDDRTSRFSVLCAAGFSNSRSDVLQEINRFIDFNEKAFGVRAIYVEMNGFDINYDRWYFDLFAYDRYTAGFENVEWLCEWQSEDWPEVELVGATSAREVFAWYHANSIWKKSPELKPIYEASMLLVMTKFVQFIGSALQAGSLTKPVPVLVSAHGFETVARYEP